MAANQVAVLLISQKERPQLTELARQRGFDDPDDYIRALVEADAEQHGILLDLHEEDIRVKFKRAFRDALNNDVLTEEEFWKEISDDE